VADNKRRRNRLRTERCPGSWSRVFKGLVGRGDCHPLHTSGFRVTASYLIFAVGHGRPSPAEEKGSPKLKTSATSGAIHTRTALPAAAAAT
jgi:hypothetical protein